MFVIGHPKTVSSSMTPGLGGAAVHAIEFDVFGKRILALRNNGAWELFETGNEGRSRRYGGTIVPPDLSENELLTFLDDFFHAYATPRHAHVRRVR